MVRDAGYYLQFVDKCRIIGKESQVVFRSISYVFLVMLTFVPLIFLQLLSEAIYVYSFEKILGRVV